MCRFLKIHVAGFRPYYIYCTVLIANFCLYFVDFKMNSKFTCQFCNSEFLHNSTLRRHVRNYHPGAALPACQKLGRKVTVGNHQEYRCTLCECRFSHRSSLPRHMKAKHNSTEAGQPTRQRSQPENVCACCNKRFMFRRNMLKHLKAVHPQYVIGGRKSHLPHLDQCKYLQFNSVAG